MPEIYSTSFSLFMRNRCKHCGKAPNINKWYMLSYQIHDRNVDRRNLATRYWKGVKAIPSHEMNSFIKKSSVGGYNLRFHKNMKARDEGEFAYNSKHFIHCPCHKTRWYLEDINDSERPERYNRLSRQRY